MTDRYFAFTVLLDKDRRDDDSEYIINAIRMIKGVIKVEPHVSDPELWAAHERAKSEIEKKIWDALRSA